MLLRRGGDMAFILCKTTNTGRNQRGSMITKFHINIRKIKYKLYMQKQMHISDAKANIWL